MAINCKSEKSELEPAVQALVEAAGAPAWRAATEILLVNSAILAPQARTGRLVVAREVSGVDVDDLDDFQELVTARGEAALSGLIGEVGLGLVRKFAKEYPRMVLGGDDRVDRAQVVAATVQSLHDDKSLDEAIETRLFAEATRLSDFSLGKVLAWVREILDTQQRVVGEVHEEMASQLLKLKYAEPWLSVSVCPLCLGYDLTISNFARARESCGSCGREWFSAELLLLRPEFEKVKRENQDMSLFASAYLRHKAAGAFDIWPEALLNGDAQQPVQVDVAIKELRMGIECKMLEVPHVVTAAKLNNIVGKLVRQARAYASAGVRRYVAITNLGEAKAAAAQEKVMAAMNRSELLDEVRVVPGDLDVILSVLDDIAHELTGCFERGVQEQAQAVVRKSESPGPGTNTAA